MTNVRSERKRLATLALLMAGSALCATAPAHAQTATTKTASEAVTTADGQIDDIVVFARKRAENVQDVPIPITTISAQTLQRQNLVNFTNFQYKFPSFSVYLTNPKQLNLGIRGLGNNGFNTDGIDGSVGIFVDGVYSGRQGMVSGDFNDIADIELLRGPQGTLFGKNTTAGAVIINSQAPSFTPQLTAEGTLGNYDLKQIKLNASGPLIADKLAMRLSGFYSDQDGTYPNLNGGAAANARQGEGFRLQLLATPTSAFKARLIAAHSEQRYNTPGPVTLSIYNPAALQARMAAAGFTLTTSDAERREVNIDSPLNARTHSNVLSLTVDWDLAEKGAITSISAYQNWTCYTNNDNDYTPLDAITDYGSCNKERQWSQELRWASPKDKPIEAVAGGFLSRQYLGVHSRLRFGRQYNIWAANPSATLFPTVGGLTWAQGAYATQLAGLGFRSQAVFHTDTNALFGNVVWHPDTARKWGVELGLRHTWEDRDYSYNGVVASNFGNLSQAQINALSRAGANAQLGQATDALTDKALSGQAGLNYKFSPDIMVYATYARGHKSAGFNLLPYNSTNPDPTIAQAIALGAAQHIKGEEADNYEIGFKSEFWERRALFNVTAFNTLVKNYQANQSIGVGNTALRFLSNVGSVRSKGVEVEAELRPVDGLHLKGLLAYNRATYDSFPNSACPAQITALSCNLTGRQVAWAPMWTSDLTVDYNHDLGEGMTGYALFDVNWRSAQNTTITLDPAARVQAYALASLRVGATFRNGAIDVQGWVENLFDKAYYINLLGLTASTGIVQGYPGNPRTYGVTLRYHY